MYRKTWKRSTHMLAAAMVASSLALVATTFAADGHAVAKDASEPDFVVTVPSAYGFADTVELLKGAMAQENLMVIKEVDVQKMLRMVGVKTGGMKQIMFFHPRFMKQIRSANPLGALEAPLKLIVMERPDGKVIVRYVKPSHLFGRYQGLDEIGGTLDRIVARIISAVKK